MKLAAAAAALLAIAPRSATAAVATDATAAEPNPPTWPASVLVFDTADSAAAIEEQVAAVYARNGGRHNHGQFSPDRFALLFMPGTYPVDVPVGFYTQVLGLGVAATDVVFTGEKGVHCEEGDYDFTVGALDTFWRGAENFETRATHVWTETAGMLWAVSQAAPLRRVVVTENLKLFQYRQGDMAAGYASGGFMGDSIVQGHVASGSQQQWLTRNSNVGGWLEGVWNMVYVGVEGAPAGHCGVDPKMCSAPYVVVDKTPLSASKPFITADPATGKYSLIIPNAVRGTSGAPGDVNGSAPAVANTVADFSSVYVARNASDTAATINAKLAVGLHVVLSPGVYSLEASLQLTTPGQVLLGLGMATLIATQGTPAVTVPCNVTGARVAGLLLQAGTTNSDALLRFGDATAPGNGGAACARGKERTGMDDTHYGFIHDVFARVGGPALPTGDEARATVMVQIDANSVVADNMWLWRADHVEGGGLVKNMSNPCDHGLVVNGDDVTAYGLAAEHTLKDIVQWNGDGGATYFFQAEMPYDVKEYPYAGYAVADSVTSHTSYGAGVYHYFRDYPVTVQTAITCPAALEASFVAPLAVFLNGLGTVLHILNDKGATTAKPATPGADPAWICGNTSSTTTHTAAQHGFLRDVTFAQRRPGLRHGAGGGGAGPATCKVGDTVPCPGGGGAMCAGNECCQGGVTCPSADPRFQCCPKPKTVDCTKPSPGPGPAPPGPSPSPKTPSPRAPSPSAPAPKAPSPQAPAPKAPSPKAPSPEAPSPKAPSPKAPSPKAPAPKSPGPHCDVNAEVRCPGSAVECAGSQCCPDGSVCPSAPDTFHGCPQPKDEDCTK